MIANLAEKKPQQSTQQVLFKEREDGILEYCGDTEPPPEGEGEWAAVEAWQGLDATKDESTWTQASIAAAIQPVYAKETMQTFGLKIGHTPQHLRRLSRTYKFFTGENERRRSNSRIFFWHHVVAMRHKDPGHALDLAAENGWSTRQLEEWVFKQKAKALGIEITEETLSALMRWNEHCEEVIEEDFIALCPDRKYGQRVFGEWLEDLRGENKRLYLKDLRIIVVDAIEKSAARTIKEIVSKTGKKQKDIEAVIYQLCEEEEYEWIEERGETEEARGSVKTILVKFGASHGGAYNAPRASGAYHDPNLGGNSDW